jgi:hypothetical protein
VPFVDRVDAGRRLAGRLRHLRGADVVVLGLPRGGVPVAAEVARALGAPLGRDRRAQAGGAVPAGARDGRGRGGRRTGGERAGGAGGARRRGRVRRGGGGHALIDRELYLPAAWTDDRDHCRAAGIPEETGFATKPELAVRMLERVHATGALRGWFTADEAFGQNPGLRDWLAGDEMPYVLATRNDDLLTCPDGHREQANVLAVRTANASTTGPRWPCARPGGRRGGATGCWSASRPPPPMAGPRWSGPTTAAPGPRPPRYGS